MTPKQKLRSLDQKMNRMKRMDFDIEEASRHFYDIERYYKLQREHFHLKFQIEHCPTCYKKL